MKILIYSANYAPEPTGIGKYSGEMAEWLAEQGHEVRVVAAPPYYPNWKVARDHEWPNWYRREQIQGVDVWRAPLWVPAQPGGLKRILHTVSFAISSLPVMLRQIAWQPDVVLTVAPALTCAPMGWLTARLCGATAWLHVQDFEVEVAFQMSLLKGRLLKNMTLWCERHLLRRFDKVSTISSKMTDKLRSKGVDADAIEMLPNWVDTTHITQLDKPSRYRAELGIKPDQIVAMFSGTWGGKQHLLAIPAAARLMAHRQDIVFVICGDGVMRPALELACTDLPNVRLLPLQPKESLSELLGMADIHLLTQCAQAEDLVLPSKLAGMLSSGRPVVATCHEDTELAHVLTHCGLITRPACVNSLAQAIQTLADEPDRRLALGAQARLYAEHSFAKDSILIRWMSALESSALPVTVGAYTENEAR